MSDIPEIKLDIVSVPITAKPRKLKATWTLDEWEGNVTEKVEIINDPIKKLMKNIGYAVEPDEVKEIKKGPQGLGFDIEQELIKTVSEQIQKEVDKDILNSILPTVSEKEQQRKKLQKLLDIKI
jgi:hypothetical protein